MNGLYIQILMSVAYAVVAAIFYSMLGYFKRSDSKEVFEGEQFFVSLAVGVIAGIVAIWLNVQPQEALVLILADTGLVYAIENTAKAIWRRWLSPWFDKKVAVVSP